MSCLQVRAEAPDAEEAAAQVLEADRPPVPAGWSPAVGDDVIVLSMGAAAGKVTATSGPKGRVTVKVCPYKDFVVACIHDGCELWKYETNSASWPPGMKDRLLLRDFELKCVCLLYPAAKDGNRVSTPEVQKDVHLWGFCLLHG